MKYDAAVLLVVVLCLKVARIAGRSGRAGRAGAAPEVVLHPRCVRHEGEGTEPPDDATAALCQQLAQTWAKLNGQSPPLPLDPFLAREQRAAGGAPLVAGDPSWHQRAAVRFEEVQRLQGIVAVQEEELAQLRRQVQAGGAAGSLSPPRSPLPPQLAPPLEPAALEDGNNGPEDGDIDELPDAALEEPTVELEGDGPLSAELMWDSAAWPGPDRELPVRNLSHPAGRFDRPLLVRFWNYNISKPVKQPYGGEATRRWFQRYGYAETNSDDWDLLWCGKGQYKALAARGLDLPRRWQKHNHCFSAGLLAGNKHSFVVHHNEMLRHFGPQEYGHVPEMYHLPMERNSLMQAMRAEPDAVWILKPSTGARGEGIKLLSRPEQLPRLPTKDTVQRYIADPYLIEQRKVHLRLYLVIAEVAPLRLLLFKDGLALFASEEYDTNPAHHDNLFVHLTNAATMKGVAPDPTRDAEYNNGGDHEKSRLAWALRPFLQHLEAEGRDAAAIMRAVKDALVKTLLSGQARAQFAYRRPGSCFDLFGVDVMFDAAMKPYVLEINLAPQLNSPGRVNQRVHERLLYQLIGLMGRRPTPSPQFDALVKRAKAVALAHGMPLCALWTAPEPREPQWSPKWMMEPAADADRRGCVGEEAVHAVAHLVDEAAHLGLFERIYPAANHHNYDKYWLHPAGPTAAQRLTGLWAAVELEVAGAADTGGWVADLQRDDTEYTAMGLLPVLAGNPTPISTLSPRPTPAPPLGTAQPPPILTPPIVLHEERKSYEVLRQQLQTRADEMRRTKRPQGLQSHDADGI
jgi:hypothetical protein